MLGDDNYTDSMLPSTLNLAIRGSPDNRAAQDFLLLGAVGGARKEEHFTGGSLAGGG